VQLLLRFGTTFVIDRWIISSSQKTYELAGLASSLRNSVVCRCSEETVEFAGKQ
jgi:hypothetical protein